MARFTLRRILTLAALTSAACTATPELKYDDSVSAGSTSDAGSTPDGAVVLSGQIADAAATPSPDANADANMPGAFINPCLHKMETLPEDVTCLDTIPCVGSSKECKHVAEECGGCKGTTPVCCVQNSSFRGCEANLDGC